MKLTKAEIRALHIRLGYHCGIMETKVITKLREKLAKLATNAR